MFANIGIILSVITLPFRKVLNWIWREMCILKLRYQQWKYPSNFLMLLVLKVDFNPKAYERKEQDYLELSLRVFSGLLSDLHLSRLTGTLSIDGTSPADKFMINENCIIYKTGKITDFKLIVVPLLQGTQGYIHARRQNEDDVNVHVNLSGYHKDKLLVKLDGETRLRVKKLPNT